MRRFEPWWRSRSLNISCSEPCSGFWPSLIGCWLPEGYFLRRRPTVQTLLLVDPVLLQHLAEAYGFVDVRVDLVSVPGVPWKLDPAEDLGAVGEAVLGLQEYVLSGQDALLLAYRPTEATPRRE